MMSPMLKIGPIQFSQPTVFAPLAGITNLPMRLLARTQASVLLAKAPPEADPGNYQGKLTC